ncbi:hypothetical protein [Thalassospira sp.]|uniref:hypothetical protein n=1 Tax=Thalassospira sp. TaxID=1912094 RepID=UPI0027344F63|nr:hypothetical protein [Thalassospira sp.]MDP2699268.1 hypothetical protein [Thalassospira sp.]
MAVSLVSCGGSAPPPGSTNDTYRNPAMTGNSPQRTRTSPAIQQTIPPRRQAIPPRPVTVAPEPAPDENADAIAETPPETAAIPFVPSLDVNDLIGQTEAAVTDRLGEPELVRGEGPSRVWQYRTDRCIFDAFFFPQTENAPRHLAHMIARLRNGEGEITLQNCLDDIMRSLHEGRS